MAEKILCVLAGFDPATQNTLAGLQESLYAAGFTGRQTKDIPMHCTLTTVPAGAGEEAALLTAMEAAARATAPVGVSFSHLGLFSGGEVLFAAPDVTRPMLDLQERFGPSGGWAAHATLLIDDAETIVRALPTAVQGFKSITGSIEMLYLYEFQPPRLIAALPLTGK